MKYAVLLFACVAMSLSGCDSTRQILNNLPQGSSGLTSTQIAAGLKEALTIGTQNSSNSLSVVNGYFANAAIKILLPPEAQKIESTLRSVGLGSAVDKAVLSLNRAAEEAAKSAAPIFVGAIKQMTITDALGILKGGDNAATNFFKSKTTSSLTAAFSPVIGNALNKVDATKYWADMFSLYNKFAKQPVNTDLTAYVTGRAIDGIFYQVGLEEQKIRENPSARVTDLLKKVFGSSQAQSGK